MRDSTRIKVIYTFTILGTVVGIVIGVLDMFNWGSPFFCLSLYTMIGFLIGLSLPSVPLVVGWLWEKVTIVTDYVPFWGGSVIVASIIIYFTSPFWGTACLIISIYRFVRIKKGFSTEYWRQGEPREIKSDKQKLIHRAELGDTHAMRELAISYLKVDQDIDNAFNWIAKAAELGNIEAMADCADICRKVNKYEDAFYWDNEAANLGNAVSMYNLSVCYRDGLGVSTDLAKHKYWYNKAKESGFAPVQGYSVY